MSQDLSLCPEYWARLQGRKKACLDAYPRSLNHRTPWTLRKALTTYDQCSLQSSNTQISTTTTNSWNQPSIFATDVSSHLRVHQSTLALPHHIRSLAQGEPGKQETWKRGRRTLLFPLKVHCQWSHTRVHLLKVYQLPVGTLWGQSLCHMDLCRIVLIQKRVQATVQGLQSLLGPCVQWQCTEWLLFLSLENLNVFPMINVSTDGRISAKYSNIDS